MNRERVSVLVDVRCVYTRRMARQAAAGAGGAYDLRYHVVWCAKYRRRVLTGEVRARCEELIRGRCAEHDWPVIALEVMPDYVHVFVKAHPGLSPSYIANQLKGLTSRVLREEFPRLRSRLPTLWSRSYFAATAGAVSAAAVQRYIDTQYERPWRKEASR